MSGPSDDPAGDPGREDDAPAPAPEPEPERAEEDDAHRSETSFWTAFVLTLAALALRALGLAARS